MITREREDEMRKFLNDNHDVEALLKYAEDFCDKRKGNILERLLTENDLVKLQAEYKACIEMLNYVREMAKRAQRTRKTLANHKGADA